MFDFIDVFQGKYIVTGGFYCSQVVWEVLYSRIKRVGFDSDMKTAVEQGWKHCYCERKKKKGMSDKSNVLHSTVKITFFSISLLNIPEVLKYCYKKGNWKIKSDLCYKWYFMPVLKRDVFYIIFQIYVLHMWCRWRGNWWLYRWQEDNEKGFRLFIIIFGQEKDLFWSREKIGKFWSHVSVDGGQHISSDGHVSHLQGLSP